MQMINPEALNRVLIHYWKSAVSGKYYRIVQLCGGGNIGEFGKSSAIRQYFTYQYFPLIAHYNFKIIIYWLLILSDLVESILLCSAIVFLICATA